MINQKTINPFKLKFMGNDFNVNDEKVLITIADNVIRKEYFIV